MTNQNLRVERLGETGRIRLLVHGALDISGVPALDAAIGEARDGTTVVVDLRNVEFIDSSGLALLLDQTEQAGRRGAELRVVPSRDVLAVLTLARVTDELNLDDE